MLASVGAAMMSATGAATAWRSRLSNGPVEVSEVASRTSGATDRPWTRWQDWVAVVLGGYLVLGTLWTTTTGGAHSVMLVLGLLLLVSGVWSLATPDSITSEYAHMVLGVLLFLAPWVLGYVSFAGAAWTCWIIGVLAVIIGAATLPQANAARRGR